MAPHDWNNREIDYYDNAGERKPEKQVAWESEQSSVDARQALRAGAAQAEQHEDPWNERERVMQGSEARFMVVAQAGFGHARSSD